ncbi:unnamed protein product [Strongylus vulgaris]|uniref:Uncharacterized protein n=1 Tax=Strongylus vulgaris TaxID=40348 RepID=A0A3P7I1N0_STRVU|nr:unnamed protein product [Strongylus vulgaris]
MQKDFAGFRANLASMVNGMEGSGMDITSFIFWGFVFTDSNVLTYYIGYGHQLSDLDNIFDVLVFSTSSPNQPFLSQIIQAQQFYGDTRAFSNVLVFTDSGASDAGPPSDLFSANTNEQILISLVNTWHNKASRFFKLLDIAVNSRT